MALLRESDGFPDVFGIAARDLPDPAAFLEKDYWVTQVLRALNDAAPGGFVLKGGTSLSKGYRIINRFSEDIDIFVVRHAGESARKAEGRLKGLVETVAGSLGLEWGEARAPGRGRHPSRGDSIRYPGAHTLGFTATINPDAVLFETRIAEGDAPSEMCEIRTLIGEWSEINVDEFDDLEPFRIRVLEPRRTLIEKLVAVHHSMSTWSTENAPNRVSRSDPESGPLITSTPAPASPGWGGSRRRSAAGPPLPRVRGAARRAGGPSCGRTVGRRPCGRGGARRPRPGRP